MHVGQGYLSEGEKQENPAVRRRKNRILRRGSISGGGKERGRDDLFLKCACLIAASGSCDYCLDKINQLTSLVSSCSSTVTELRKVISGCYRRKEIFVLSSSIKVTVKSRQCGLGTTV